MQILDPDNDGALRGQALYEATPGVLDLVVPLISAERSKCGARDETRGVRQRIANTSALGRVVQRFGHDRIERRVLMRTEQDLPQRGESAGLAARSEPRAEHTNVRERRQELLDEPRFPLTRRAQNKGEHRTVARTTMREAEKL